MREPGLVRRMAAECIATFALVFAGCGAIVTDSIEPGSLGAIGVSVVFGLIVMAMVYGTGHLSGAHLNPAVTIAFVLTRHFPPRDAAAYVSAQILGSLLAAFALLALWPDRPADLGATIPSVGVARALPYEAVATALLMFVIVAVATDTRAVGAAAALAIGGSIALGSIFVGPLTGASMNPARSLGPAVASGTWADFWVYVAGPLVGAALGAIAYQSIRAGSKERVSN